MLEVYNKRKNMKNIVKLSVSVLLIGFVFIGCRSAAVYNVSNSQIETTASVDKIYTAIKKAGYSKGWNITKVKDGLAQGELNLRTHKALVDIPYSKNSFSINYKNSTNLKFDPTKGTIHKNYNGWIQNLENAIKFEVQYLDK